jgi:hypothetical protein
MGAGAEAVGPALAGVEVAQEREEPVRRRVQMRGELGDLVTEALGVGLSREPRATVMPPSSIVACNRTAVSWLRSCSSVGGNPADLRWAGRLTSEQPTLVLAFSRRSN